MTWYILQFSFIVFAIWFLNGLRKVWRNPRFKVVSYDSYDTCLKRYGDKVNAVRLTVKRQEFLPPFRLLEETWIMFDYENMWHRVPDGKKMHKEDCSLHNQYLLMLAEEAHLEKTMEIK